LERGPPKTVEKDLRSNGYIGKKAGEMYLGAWKYPFSASAT